MILCQCDAHTVGRIDILQEFFRCEKLCRCNAHTVGQLRCRPEPRRVEAWATILRSTLRQFGRAAEGACMGSRIILNVGCILTYFFININEVNLRRRKLPFFQFFFLDRSLAFLDRYMLSKYAAKPMILNVDVYSVCSKPRVFVKYSRPG